MYVLKKAINKGFNEGIKDGIEDKKKGQSVKFKKIDVSNLKSTMYDLGYVKGYNKVNGYVYKKKNLQE